jgi:hypothetical protein
MIQIVEQFEALGSTIGLRYSMVSVIDANVEENVYMNSFLLVYISTYKVVFGGKPIVNVNDALPYLPIDHDMQLLICRCLSRTTGHAPGLSKE